MAERRTTTFQLRIRRCTTSVTLWTRNMTAGNRQQQKQLLSSVNCGHHTKWQVCTVAQHYNSNLHRTTGYKFSLLMIKRKHSPKRVLLCVNGNKLLPTCSALFVSFCFCEGLLKVLWRRLLVQKVEEICSLLYAQNVISCLAQTWKVTVAISRTMTTSQ